MYKKILAATDLTHASRAALRDALALAHRLGSRLTVLYVVDAAEEQPTWFLPDSDAVEEVRHELPKMDERFRRKLREVVAELTTPDMTPQFDEPLLRHGNPPDEIVAAATELGVDLIVTGTHGRRGFRHAIMGSVAEKIVRLAKQAVLVVKPDPEKP